MIERYFPDPTHRSLVYVSFAFLAILGIYALIAALLRRYGKNPKYLIPRNTIRKVAVPLLQRDVNIDGLKRALTVSVGVQVGI